MDSSRPDKAEYHWLYKMANQSCVGEDVIPFLEGSKALTAGHTLALEHLAGRQTDASSANW